MRYTFLVLALFVTAISMTSCRQKPDDTPAPSPKAPANPESEDGSSTSVPVEGSFQVKFETTKGDFVVEVYPEWAPIGAARFKELVESDFFDENRFFRLVPGFIVQWGIAGDPAVQAKWRSQPLQDEPMVGTNERGTITFAKGGPNSRTTQLFINYGDNSGSLDPQGFPPFGKVIEGMDVVDSLNSEYGERPDQGQIQSRGNEYLKKSFPNLDYIKSAEIIQETKAPAEPVETPAAEPEMTTSSPAEAGTSTPAPVATSTAPAEGTSAPAGTSSVPVETIEEIQ
ncbi:peptidylprolyl isomerase [uncultured Rubinisphaera sp.]|uniref:peptidylprolyl isomerase n=1 Tax=uncultured Rubinisphaera sp. TaxID=1678686 RepID=UPI0026793E56|tara:strand:+ start:1620 stop:2471 length:852 start_codon:yes stop_codon:yes gene_type:complete